jgi:ketosteroid isomerase-like protein
MSTATLNRQSWKDEADIRALIETIHTAHRNKDAAAIVAPYAQDAAVFDLAPPLSHKGMDLQQKKAWLETWEGPVDLESRDFNITVSGDIAFCHGFYRMSGTPRAAGRSVSGCGQRCA